MYKVSSINAIIRAIFPSKWSGERKYRIAFSPYGGDIKVLRGHFS